MPRVIHTAQALVDVVVAVPALPPRGGNVHAQAAHRYAGGAVNILLAAARQGAEAVHAGAIGTGPNGDLIRASLDAEGVRYSAPAVPDEDTGSCFVLVEPTAERTFITTMEGERRISASSLATSLPQPGDLVCVSGYSLQPPTLEPLAAWVAELLDGVVVVLDPGAPFAFLPEGVRTQMLARTDVWTSNAQEASELTGVEDPAESPAAVADLLPAHAVVIVRDGPNGCWVHEAGGTIYIPGFPQTPVDTNGAGDAHTGALVAERALGTPWEEAARRANAVGAIKVTRHGPATAPRRSEVDAFLAGWRPTRY